MRFFPPEYFLIHLTCSVAKSHKPTSLFLLFFSKWDIITMSSTYDTSNNFIMAFDAKRSPIELNWLATGDSSYNLNVWNTKTRNTCSELSLFHGCDVLTVNWHRLNTNLIFSGGSDGLIRLWDLRNHHQPVKR